MDDGEAEVLGNAENIQAAFIFCPNMGTIQMDKILEQGTFISEREMSEMVETRSCICNKYTAITFEKEDSTKSNLQTVKDYLKDMKSKKGNTIPHCMRQAFSVLKKTQQCKLVTQQCRKSDGIENYTTNRLGTSLTH